MPVRASTGRILRFHAFELNTATGQLRKAGIVVRLRPQAAKILIELASRPGQVVTREQLKEEIWGRDVFVDFEHGLNLCIREIRATLDDDAEKPRFIETLPRLGYRFVAQVEEASSKPETLIKPDTRGSPDPQDAPPSPQPPRPYRPLAWAIAVVAAAVILTVIATVGSAGIRARLWRRSEPVRIHSLAVLPLENLSRDPDQEYFADGMTDELITDLAQIHALRVISRNSVMQYKGRHKPVQQIARELNVDAVIEGTVMRSDDRVRITAQLIQAPEDRHLWADTYEGELRNILALQDQVARAIAGEVKVALSPKEEAKLGAARMVNPEAHEAYLRGLYELRISTVQSYAKATQFFQAALAIDPNDALSYEGLSIVYSSSPDQAPKTVMPKARAAALKAIELDDSLAEAHSSLGFVKLVFDWDWAGAEQELRRALEANPNSALAHVHYARYLLLVPHRIDEGVQEFEIAYRLDPAVPGQVDDLVAFLFFARRYQAAVDEAAKELDNSSPFLALAYAELGRRDEALAVAARAAAAAKVPTELAQTASAYALAGNKERAYGLLAQLLQQANQHYLCGMNVAAVYSVLGDKDRAMAWLEKGYRDHSI